MKKLIAAASLALLALVNTIQAQINIPINVDDQYGTNYGLWTDTGTSVTNGEWININASGLWNVAGQAQNGNTPDGIFDYSTDLFLDNGISGGLIAYVGENPFQGEWILNGSNGFFPQSTNYWQVGTSFQFCSANGGELWLGFDDDANGSPTDDNNGVVEATVSFGFSTNTATDTDLALSVAQVSSNSFSFYISNGIPLSVCAIYDSSDLEHWTLIDSLLLDNNGSSSEASSLLGSEVSSAYSIVNGAYANTTGVPYRFYKVTDGQFISKTIGYARITVGQEYAVSPSTNYYTGTNSIIANQFEAAAGNTLDGLFNPMADGTYLPADSQIVKWNGSSFVYYTWDGTGWGGNGAVSLNPGEAAYLIITPTNNPVTITFAGLVEEGTSSLSVSSNSDVLVSSMLPKAGGITSTLDYSPNYGDSAFLWTTNTYYDIYEYGGGGRLDPDYAWRTTEPVLQVGQGFFLETSSSNNVWVQNYSSRHF